jgi:ATP-dependent Lon protease
MSQDLLQLPDDFDGTVRLFPLPNFVLFPRVAQPLHIFEPRYRQLMADALDSDRLITMALLQPDWEQGDQKRPPIHEVVCIGRVLNEQRQEDGRYNFLLHGLARARIVNEHDSETPYRMATVELIEDVPAVEVEAVQLRSDMAEAASPFFGGHPGATEQFRRLIDSPITLGGLCDVFAFALPVDLEGKQRLLAEPDVVTRARLLLTLLEDAPRPAGQPSPTRRWPPGFSVN